MENIFHPSEIIRIAVNVERNGQTLFGMLQEKATDQKIKDMWGYLKEQEIHHQKIFADILSDTENYFVDEYNPGEYGAFLQAIASEYIVTQEVIEQRTKELFTSDLEAINFGIFIEKESIMTYSVLRDYVKSEHQDIIDKVIDEEKKHLVNLYKIKQTLTA